MAPQPPQAKTANEGSREITVRVAEAKEVEWCDAQLGARHYLGAGRSVGDYLRQIVERGGVPVAVLVWGPSCYALKDRDRWIGWSATTRVERLKLIVQNRRYLLLSEKGAEPNLASQALAAALRVLPAQWRENFGYRPLLAESFTDPEAYEGTCYKASNWEAVGTSAGYSRHRIDFYVANDAPKRLWLRELTPGDRARLRGAVLPMECQPGVRPAPSGVLPLKQPECDSLFEVLRHVPDPRSKNTRFRIGGVLTIIAMALLVGRREIAEIARFANSLTQAQRRRLSLPRKVGTQAFYQVPSYSVFYQLLARLDPEPFAQQLSTWLAERTGSLPGALALDGKMIREHIGLLTLADHDDGTPHAVAVIDQKEGTPRCEQSMATALIAQGPALDGKLVTADALHCQKDTARAIVEKGGDYLLQIKGNQPTLLARAEAFDQQPGTFFLPSSIAATAASTTGKSTPSPSIPSKPVSPSPAA